MPSGPISRMEGTKLPSTYLLTYLAVEREETMINKSR